MSHTTTVNSIAITNVHALRSAVEELARRGMKIKLEQNAVPRAYSSGQQGMGLADYVVRLHDSRYDIGLYDNGKGEFEARTDFWDHQVERVLGVTPKEGEDVQQAKMGKLFQMYAVHAAEQQALRQGHSVVRNELGDGTIQLQVAVA